jgi:hypothetical protein
VKQTRRSYRLLFLALLLGFAFHAFGQEATILGTVTDPSGSVIPNATVTITSIDTGQVYPGKTNDSGQYLMPALINGKYKIKVEASGFKSSERNDIVLNVGDRARADFQMQVGDTSVTLNVEADAVKVQSDSSEVSDVITGQQITQLATNGRSIYSLTTLLPGASGNQGDFQAPTAVSGDNNVSFNGMRKSSTLYLVDGGEDLDRGGSGNISILPSIDAVGEFRALTSNYSSEFGLASGATFTLVFKSGTKDFHASAWEFARNDALDAGNYFTNAAGKTPPKLRSNTYGFNVGGPVFIPKLYNKDRNKTFFFYNMEWRKLIQGQSLNQTVPLTSEYGGIFPSSTVIHVPSANQLSAALIARYAALGLSPGQAFPGNAIPSSLLDSNAQLLLKTGIFPSPNNGGTKFVGGANPATDVREEIVRIDHQFTDKFWIFGHYVAEQVSQGYGTPTWSGDNVPTVGSVFGNPAYSGVVHATYAISPTLVNETAFNYNGNRISITPTGVFARPSGLTIPEIFPGNNDNRIPAIFLQKSNGTAYDSSSFPWHNKADDYQMRDDISWTKGSHQLKMGASFALYKKIQDLFGNTQGRFNFNGSYSGNDFADFLLGYSTGYSELAVQDSGRWDNKSYAAYIQDNWRVNARLTLNLGLRWDGIPHTYEESNRGSNFYPNLYNPANAAVLLPGGNAISPSSPGLGPSPNSLLNGYQFYLNGIGIAGQNGVPPGLVNNHWANFGPRVGFAYDITGSGKTIVRGGFGTFYERVEGNDMYNGGPNVPFSANPTFSNVSLSNPNTSLQTGGTVVAPISVPSITGVVVSDYKNPLTYQYSAGVQRQLAENTVLSVSYVGNLGRHLNDYRETNLPNQSVLPCLSGQGNPACSVPYNTVVPYSGFSSIRLSENAENSHYNSLQVDFHTQVKKDLTLQFGYTLSRSIDPVFGNNNGDLANVSDPYNRGYDYGLSNFDRTHVAFADFVYDLPIFRNSDNHLLKGTLGGWELSGVLTAESGLPLNITLGGPQGGNGIPNATNRPNVGSTVSQPNTINNWIDPSGFSTPAYGQWGNLAKGAFRGPGRQNWNISLFKSFTFSESRGSRFELRVETFNTFNHTQFNGVSSTYTASDFGKVTSVYDPRVFQLAGKLYF